MPDEYDIDSLRLTRSYVRLICDGDDVTNLRAIIGATGDEHHLVTDLNIRYYLSIPQTVWTADCPRAMAPQFAVCGHGLPLDRPRHRLALALDGQALLAAGQPDPTGGP